MNAGAVKRDTHEVVTRRRNTNESSQNLEDAEISVQEKYTCRPRQLAAPGILNLAVQSDEVLV